MNLSLIIIDIFILVFAIVGWKNYIRGKKEMLITHLHVVLLVFTAVCIIAALNSFRIRGNYTHLAIGTAFLCSAALLSAVTRSVFLKIWTRLLLLPVIMIHIGLLGLSIFLLPALVPAFLFEPPEESFGIDQDRSIEVRTRFMGPQPVFLARRKSGAFNQQYRLRMQHREQIHMISAVDIISSDSFRVTFKDPYHHTCTDTAILIE